MKEGRKALVASYKKLGARIETKVRTKLKTKDDFSRWYTPGVGAAANHLAKYPEDARKMSVKKNSVAVISDGSAVLGLGNIGPYGALPVMEGKALIFKEMAGIDAWPIVLDTQDLDKIVETIINISPSFGGINLEDFAAPQCFEIEQRLIKELSIPVMHDDQHGTAIVVLAGLINATKIVKKRFSHLRVVISGAGAAGTAVAKLLLSAGITDVVMVDRSGVIYPRREGLALHKKELASITNPRRVKGNLEDALYGADAFIGLSGAETLSPEIVSSMASQSIVFALANPIPEILPDEAYKYGAVIVATGRSDFPNQINNALVFPGIFRGALDKEVVKITEDTKLRAARALARLVGNPTTKKIIPDLLDARVVSAVARSVR